MLSMLAERFETTRLALNDIADRQFSIGDTNNAVETLLERSRIAAEVPLQVFSLRPSRSAV